MLCFGHKLWREQQTQRGQANTRVSNETMDSPHLAIIINASSGTNDKAEAQQRLKDIFEKAEIDARISLAQSGDEIVRLARGAATLVGCEVVVAGGGDGTINAVASALVGTKKILGVLPFGTLNGGSSYGTSENRSYGNESGNASHRGGSSQS